MRKSIKEIERKLNKKMQNLFPIKRKMYIKKKTQKNKNEERMKQREERGRDRNG